MNKFKIVTIVGARPQFIKAAALSRAVRENAASSGIREMIVHTGQHYDDNMSRIFFEELGIPKADHNLGVGSGSHGQQTGGIMLLTEKILLEEKPDMVVVYGDTNSTLAGALAASKLHIPVAHIEAGLRSFNKTMPEEINRIACDHVSTLLFTPTETGYKNLGREGFNTRNKPPFSIDKPAVFHCGDVMYDNAMFFSASAPGKSKILSELNAEGEEFVLVTLHRDNNTDSADRLNAIVGSLLELSSETKTPFILPLHPRTRKMMPELLDRGLYERMKTSPYLKVTEPLGYLDMLILEKHCRMIITDSGGVQKESYFFQKPCLVLRPETEWKELIDLGTARITDADPEKIRESFHYFLQHPPENFPPVFGDGRAAEFIVHEILNFLRQGLVN
jgi:UDP-GlcNAc3NAcA epimerase